MAEHGPGDRLEYRLQAEFDMSEYGCLKAGLQTALLCQLRPKKGTSVPQRSSPAAWPGLSGFSPSEL